MYVCMHVFIEIGTTSFLLFGGLVYGDSLGAGLWISCGQSADHSGVGGNNYLPVLIMHYNFIQMYLLCYFLK